VGEFRDVPYSGDRLPVTLRLADDIAEKWSLTPLAVKMAREVCRRYNTQSREDEARAIRDWIESRVVYFLDPHGAEMVGDPLFTLQYGGDCDDQAALCASLLRAIGHDARIAAVQWVGRSSPTHCVCWDATTNLILDPISVPPESWPPSPWKVRRILVMRKDGVIAPLTGFFSKIHKKIAKTFTKVFKPKTLLGKIADPFGLYSRNLKLGGKIADVVGTTALVVAGGYAVGAAAGAWGTGAAAAGATAATGGFWSGALGSTLLTAGKAMIPMVLQGLAAKKQAGQGLSAQDLAYLQAQTPSTLAQYGFDPGMGAGVASAAGGGGGAGLMPEDPTIPGGVAVPKKAVPWGLVAAVGAVGLVILASSGSPKKGRELIHAK
jgi:hypothetical protein